MCMSRHWPPPKYTMEGESGLPHERQFKIVCVMLKYKQVGMGKSKKLAKRQAAHKMWQTLRDLPESTTGIDDDEVSLILLFTKMHDNLLNIFYHLKIIIFIKHKYKKIIFICNFII